MRCAILLSLALLSASAWGQAYPSGGSTSPQPAPAMPSESIAPLNSDGTINWDSLVKASGELSTEAAQLQTDLETLQRQYDSLLILSRDADKKAQAAIRAQGLKAALWRDLALVGALGLAGALLDQAKGRGACIGAGVGGAVALAWELWPYLRARPREASAKPP